MRVLPRAGSPAARAVLTVRAAGQRLGITAALSARLTRGPRPPVLMTLVYRRAGAALVEGLVRDLLAEAQAAGSSARAVLWALDEPAPQLEPWTLGHGPGARLSLHERMREHAVGSGESGELPYWVISDDDVRYSRGSVGQLVALMEKGRIDVAGAAHAATSEWNHSFTLARPFTVARSSLFVETGPVLAFSPRAQGRVLPFPEGSAAGWGMEAHWSSRTQEGLRSAIVDAVAVDHLVPMGGSYDAVAEWERCRAFTRRYGVEDVSDLKQVVGSWRAWQPVAPWPTS